MHPPYKAATFTCRWHLTGTLKSSSPLHIGSGETITRPDELVSHAPHRSPLPVQIKAIARDFRGIPFLPGASLRGVLRAGLMRRNPQAGERLFGPADAQRAGQLIVHDCRQPDNPAVPPGSGSLPFWCGSKHTAVIASTGISRRPRTAANEKLFHWEAVPAGTVFNLEIQADAAMPEDIQWLVRVLLDGIKIGANTGDGHGRLQFRDPQIKCLTANAVRAWICGNDPAARLPWEDQTEVLMQTARDSSLADTAPAPVTIPLELNFTGFFLTKDPDRSRKKGDAEQEAHCRLSPDGEILLPASSVRGVLRAQAERILRTLGLEAGDPTDTSRVAAVWDGTGLRFHPAGDPARDLAAQMFGAPGWKSPIEITDFTGKGTPITHEMVAIDRFTGSAADSRKFTTKAIWAPTLTGRISIDMDRWKSAGCDAWAPGLLALVLRDLAEGDLHFGMGAAKGYGHCTAAIDSSAVFPGVDVTASLQALRRMIPSVVTH